MPEPDVTFTGERLHDDDPLFGLDLLRHEAAYHEAIRHARAHGAGAVLELGSGTGYGATAMARAGLRVVGLDRVAPVRRVRDAGARFVRGDLRSLPMRPGGFDLVVSFQVLEHLEAPADLLEALARSVSENGEVIVTTPNAAFSDGENPFHVHEYERDELAALLRDHFDEVEVLGVSARGEALAYHEARLARIRRIVRIDPLGLRRRLPLGVVAPIFAALARVVRRDTGAADRAQRATLADFPIEPAHARSLDLLAVCRAPRTRGDIG